MNDCDSGTSRRRQPTTTGNTTKLMMASKTAMSSSVATANLPAVMIKSKATEILPTKINSHLTASVEPSCPSNAGDDIHCYVEEDAIIDIIDMAQSIVDSSDLESMSSSAVQSPLVTFTTPDEDIITSQALSGDDDDDSLAVQVIESTLIEKLSIRFIDARNLATKARLDMGIKGYPSKIQRVQVVQQCMKTFYSMPIEIQETMKQDKCIFDTHKEAISVASSRTTAASTLQSTSYHSRTTDSTSNSNKKIKKRFVKKMFRSMSMARTSNRRQQRQKQTMTQEQEDDERCDSSGVDTIGCGTEVLANNEYLSDHLIKAIL